MPSNVTHLTDLIQKLDENSLRSLLDYAEFLLARQPETEEERDQLEAAAEPLEPAHESPSENETVIGALKRLRRTYSMLDTDKLFNQASALMSSHMLEGKPAESVIAELESLFDEHYHLYVEQFLPAK